MTRPYRSWACPCCGFEWVRRKGDEVAPFWRAGCSTCDRKLVAARTPRQRRQCVHRRSTAKLREIRERDGSRPRTRSGLILRPPASVRRAWREVRTARTRPALVRRGQRFVDALLAYTRDQELPDGTTRYRVTHDLDRNGHLRRNRSAGGLLGSPAIQLGKRAGSWGMYERSFRTGWSITLDPDQVIDEVRRTFVHEVLHLLDDEARIAKDNHGRLWQLRLAEMERLFPPEAL